MVVVIVINKDCSDFMVTKLKKQKPCSDLGVINPECVNCLQGTEDSEVQLLAPAQWEDLDFPYPFRI